MQKDPMHAVSTQAEWNALPPRHSGLVDLFNLIDGKPKTLHAFCLMCDSNTGGNWCTADSTNEQAIEIRHLSDKDVGILRPSELALIMQGLP